MAKAREVPLIMEDCALMTAGVEYSTDLLGLGPGFDPVKAQDLIEDRIERFRAGSIKEPLDENVAAYLGVFWGMSVVQAYGWNFVAVTIGDWRGFGVGDVERKYLALPVSFFHKLMHEKTGKKIPGPAAQFKAIGAKLLPASKPGDFTIIMK
jgi:hypothetical protein